MEEFLNTRFGFQPDPYLPGTAGRWRRCNLEGGRISRDYFFFDDSDVCFKFLNALDFVARY
jgi:hypothetical protein